MKKNYQAPIYEEILMDRVNDILTMSIESELPGNADIEFEF